MIVVNIKLIQNYRCHFLFSLPCCLGDTCCGFVGSRSQIVMNVEPGLINLLVINPSCNL